MPRKAADRQHCIWLLAVMADEEVFDRTDVSLASLTTLLPMTWTPITGRQLLHIDFDEFYRCGVPCAPAPPERTAMPMIAHWREPLIS